MGSPTVPSQTPDLPVSCDWHKPGLYVVYSPTNAPLLHTIELTAWASRATFLQTAPHSWSAAVIAGYTMGELALVGLVKQKL